MSLDCMFKSTNGACPFKVTIDGVASCFLCDNRAKAKTLREQKPEPVIETEPQPIQLNGAEAKPMMRKEPCGSCGGRKDVSSRE